MGSRKKWTDEELEVIRERYPKEGGMKLATHFGVSRAAIIARAKKMNLKAPPSGWKKQGSILYGKLAKG